MSCQITNSLVALFKANPDQVFSLSSLRYLALPSSAVPLEILNALAELTSTGIIEVRNLIPAPLFDSMKQEQVWGLASKDKYCEDTRRDLIKAQSIIFSIREVADEFIEEHLKNGQVEGGE